MKKIVLSLLACASLVAFSAGFETPDTSTKGLAHGVKIGADYGTGGLAAHHLRGGVGTCSADVTEDRAGFPALNRSGLQGGNDVKTLSSGPSQDDSGARIG